MSSIQNSRSRKQPSGDEAEAFSFCATLAAIFSLTLLGFSIFGMQDAYAGKSSKRAQDIENAISAWQNNLRNDFISDLSFKIYQSQGGVFQKDGATVLAESEAKELVLPTEKPKNKNKQSRDIDTRFHASSDFRSYGLSDYIIGFVEAIVPGKSMSPNMSSASLDSAVYILFENEMAKESIKLKDLGVEMFKTHRSSARNKLQCQNGELQPGGNCISYSVLSDICIVVDTNNGTLAIAYHGEEQQKPMGCTSQTFEVANYTKVSTHSAVNALSHVPQNITVRARSLQDPAIQALILTDGTFAIGMNASLKFFLSLVGCVLALSFLFCICRRCVTFQRLEHQRFKADQFRAEQLREMGKQYYGEASPDMVQIDMASEDHGYGSDKIDGESDENVQAAAISSRASARLQDRKQQRSARAPPPPKHKPTIMEESRGAIELEMSQINGTSQDDVALFESNNRLKDD